MLNEYASYKDNRITDITIFKRLSNLKLNKEAIKQ